MNQNWLSPPSAASGRRRGMESGFRPREPRKQHDWPQARTMLGSRRVCGRRLMKILGAVMLAFALAAAPVACTSAPAASVSAATPKIVIYHAEGRRSERIVWLCEELGLPYELKYRRGDVAGSFADIRAVNPGMAVAPTVFYNGELLMESEAIIQLILARHGGGRLAPAVDSPDYPI